MWFRRRQTNVKIYRYKKSQTENEELFIFKTILANHIGGRDHFFLLDAAATVDVLTASNDDLKLVETRTVHF